MDGRDDVARVRPHRFEQAITLSRVFGAVAVLAIAPLIPNLGPFVIGLLAGSLVVSAFVLHLLATRTRTAADVQRLSWIVFTWDVLIVGLAQLAMTPDALWPAIALIGMLLVISTAFRLGELGAILSAGSEIAVVVGMAAWRERALAMPFPLPYVAFDIVMFVVTALLMTSMLREYGVLRRERVELIRQVGDVESLRRTTAEHREELEREREARTAAEVAIMRLDAVRRITDTILRNSSVDELLGDTLDVAGRLSGARAVAVLSESAGNVLVRASSGLEHTVRRPIPAQGDLGSALASEGATVILDASTAAIDAHVSDTIDSRICVPLPRTDPRMVLYVGFSRHQAFTEDDRALLSLIAERIDIALDRVERAESERRAREAAEAAVEHSNLLLEVAETALRAEEPDVAIDRLVHLAVPRLADRCAAYLFREDDELACFAVADVDHDVEARTRVALRDQVVPRPRHPLWSVIRSGDGRLIERVGPQDVVLLGQNPDHLRVLLDPPLRSWLAVPIVADGTVLGALELSYATTGSAFTPDDLATARSFASRLGMAAARSRAIR